MKKRKVFTRGISALLIAVVVFSCLAFTDCPPEPVAEASSDPTVTATARIKPASGAKMKRKASSVSLKVAKLKKNTTVTVLREVFKHKKKTSAKYRWYYVKYGNYKGYIRADKLTGFSYDPVKATLKSKQKVRAGAGKKMKKRGKVAKGSTVLVYMRASAKGSKTRWYRIRHNGKTSYVTGSALNFIVEQPEPAATAAAVPQFTLKNVNGPTVWNVNTPYTVKGTITCSVPITKVKFGVKDSQNKWVFKKTVKEVNSTTFKINTLNSYLKFGELPAGSYVYKGYAYVGDTCYTLINKAFTIKQLQVPEVLTTTAISLTWPLGTEEKYYKYKNEVGAPTAAFQEAFDLVYPDRSSWGKAPKKGASCDVFVGTVCRFSGYDPEMPRGLGDMSAGQWEHLDSSPLWERVPYSYSESELQSGDIIIYKRYSGSQHICMYVVIGGKGYLAEAALKTYYGHLSTVTSGSKIFKKSDKKKIRVYRATS